VAESVSLAQLGSIPWTPAEQHRCVVGIPRRSAGVAVEATMLQVDPAGRVALVVVRREAADIDPRPRAIGNINPERGVEGANVAHDRTS
jgi:hypothetical protein